MKGFAVTQRCNTKRDKTVDLMALHEVDPSKVSTNTSHLNPLSRPLIRTDTSLDRESMGIPLYHIPAVETP